MFCSNCGVSLQSTARFCSSCGTPVHGAGSSPVSPAPSGSPPGYSFQATINAPTSSSSILLNAAGYPQPAFNTLAAALFHGLDNAIPPQRTSGLEVSKMKAYRTLGGATVPPYYGEYVLPTYASIIPIDLVPGQPQGAPVVSWAGWHQYLLQKILAEPEAAFRHLQRVCAALSIATSLSRGDFPICAIPGAVAKESLFRTKIYGMAQKGLASGVVGTRGGVEVKEDKKESSGNGQLAIKVGLNVLNAAVGNGNGGILFPDQQQQQQQQQQGNIWFPGY